MAPIKWRNRSRECEAHFDEDEGTPLIPKSERFEIVKDIVQSADLNLLLDYKYLIIASGLAIIYALSLDLTHILPRYFNVRNIN